MVTGASLGISAAKTVTYDVYATGSTFANLSSKAASYRSVVANDDVLNYTAAEHEAVLNK